MKNDNENFIYLPFFAIESYKIWKQLIQSYKISSILLLVQFINIPLTVWSPRHQNRDNKDWNYNGTSIIGLNQPFSNLLDAIAKKDKR